MDLSADELELAEPVAGVERADWRPSVGAAGSSLERFETEEEDEDGELSLSDFLASAEAAALSLSLPFEPN